MPTDGRDGFAELCVIAPAVLLGGSTGRSLSRALDLAWWWELSVTVAAGAALMLVLFALLAAAVRLGVVAPRADATPGPRTRSRRPTELLGLRAPEGADDRRIRWTPARVGIFAAVSVAAAVLAGLLRVGIDRVLA